ncbi:uncharacterized mitochondrial protein-like protein [Tanacetum coccineum]
MKGILRQFSVARTPQQNRVAERRNKTLLEAARTMLADSKLPTTFWTEAVNIACYVQNRVDNTCQARKKTKPVKDNILLPLWTADLPYSQDPKSSHDDGSKPSSDDGKKVNEDPRKDSECNDQEKEDNVNSTNNVNAASTNEVNVVGGKTSIELPFDPNMHALEDYSIFDFSRNDEDDGAEADMNNLDRTIKVSPNPTIRIHKDQPLDQVIGDLQSAIQIRKMSKNLEEHGFEEPKKVIHALKDPSWIEAMQEELLQFKLQEPLLKDEDGEEVDVHMYRSMIGSLMHLTSSRSDIMFAVCAYARYQVNPKVSYLYAVKRIFRYLKGQPKLGLWYLNDSPFDLVAYTDSDYAGLSLDRKSTTGDLLTKAFDVSRFQYLIAKTVNGEVQLQALVDRQKIIITESTVRRDLQLEYSEGGDCLPNATIFEQLTLMGSKTTVWNKFSSTMTSAIICLATNQKFNFLNYIFESMLKNLENVSGKFLMYPRKPKRKDTRIPQSSVPSDNVADEAVYKELDDSLVRAVTIASSLEVEQDSETMRDTIAQTRFENVSKLSNDPLLARAEEIVSLKRRVKKLKQKKRSRTHGLKRLYNIGLTARVKSSRDKESLGEDASKHERINAIDADEDINLVNDQDDADMFDVNTMIGDEVLAEPEVAVKDVNLTIDALAQALAALKSVKPKVKANVVEEPSVPVSAASTKVSAATTTITTTISSQPSQEKVQDKGKGIMVEEPMKSMKKKDLVRLDEEITSKLQAEFDEEERLAREKDEANVALTEEWDDIQAKVEVDYQLAQRLQGQEQEELTDEEKARLFVQFLEQRRKHFTAKRAKEKRNKPPTQAQERKIMYTYLKNMEGKKPKDLKNKSFDSIKKMFDKAFKRVNTFVDFITDLVEAEVDNYQETAKIKELTEIVPDKEEVAIDAIPLVVKPPSIIDWKIHKKGRKPITR